MQTPQVTFCPVVPEKPFVACDPSELDPLLTNLAADSRPPRVVTFPRGTLLDDGRLDLCKQQIGPAGTAAVAAALRHNRYISAVLLGADGIGDAGAQSVAGLLSDNSNVHTAFLGCNGITAVGVQAIADAIDRGAPLRGLWLKRNPIGDDGAAIIAALLRRNSTIRALDLVNTEIGHAGLNVLCQALAHENRTVRRVYLGGNGFAGDQARLIADVVRHSPALRALFLNANRFGDAGAGELAEALCHNRQLETLGIAANGIGDSGMASLLDAVRDHPALTRLDLGYCISAPAVGARENQLGDTAISAAARVLRSNRVLREIDLRRTSLTADGLAELVDALEENSTLCRLTVAIAMPQRLKTRLRRIFSRNRAANSLPPPDPDVLSIRSVYRS